MSGSASAWSPQELRWIRVAFALAGSLAVFVAYALLSALLVAAWPDRMRESVVVGQVAALAGGALGLLVVARLAGLLPPPATRRPARPGAAAAYVLWSSAINLALMGAVSGALALVAPALFESLQEWGMHVYEPLLRIEDARDVVEILLVACLVPALCEELLFRGVLQRLLRGSLGPGWSIGLTAAIFSLVHVEAIGLLGRAALGVALGLAYERTGSLRLPMLLHAANNFIAFGAFGMEAEVFVPTPWECLLILAVSLPSLALSAWAWQRALRALVPPRGP